MAAFDVYNSRNDIGAILYLEQLIIALTAALAALEDRVEALEEA